jgi:hydrogenase nickel incorporation protein HypA/HybF
MYPYSTASLIRAYIGTIMHEVGIMESALGAVLAQARVHRAQRVHRIVVRIGALAGVDADSLRFAFEALAPGTLAAEAAFEVVEVPIEVHCAACREIFSAGDGVIFACPRCGGLSGDIRQGRELELSRIEMS